MRVAVVGAGAIGSYFAARLWNAGQAVQVIARGSQLEAIRQNGIRVETSSGSITAPAEIVFDNPEDIGEVDAVILAVKAWQVREAGMAMKPLIGRFTKVLTLQNGVEAAEVLAETIGPSHVLAGVCRIVVALAGPAVVRMGGVSASILLGEFSVSSASRTTFALIEALRAIDATVETPVRMDAPLWEKLLFIAAVSGTGAVARACVGDVRDCPPTRAILLDTMNEVAAIARASEVPIAEDAVDRASQFVDQMPATATSSMQRDIADGKPSELEAIIGAPIRFAQKAGLDVPALRFLYAALLPQEQCARRR